MEEKKLMKKKKKSQDEGNLLQFAQFSQKLGHHYLDSDEHNKALREFEDECKAYKKLKMEMEMAIAYRMMGEICILLTEFEEALKYVNFYLKISKQESNLIEEQRAHATLGRIYLLQGQIANDESPKQFKAAEKYFIKSLLICKELKGVIGNIELSDMQARLYLNLGLIKEFTDKPDECISDLENAIRICRSHNLYDLLHQCYMTSGLFYTSKLDDNTKALRMFNLSLDVAERIENKKQKICETLMEKGNVLIKMGDFQSTKKLLLRAHKMKTPSLIDRQSIEDKLKIVAAICYTEDKLIMTGSTDYSTRKKLYEKMGDGCCALKNYFKAISYYSKMLEYSQLNKDPAKDLIPIYVSLYQTYTDTKQYDLALEFMWKEYEICKNDPEESCNTYLSICNVLEMADKNFWEINDIYEKARSEAQKLNDQVIEMRVVKKLVKLRRSRGMENLAELLEKEVSLIGINLEDFSEEPDEASIEDINTPDIGDEICLDDLSDSGSENEEVEQQRTTRKRGTSLTIKRNLKGETQLHLACISGNFQLAERLINQGHTINVRDHAGWLPLHEACIHGHKEIVELLLENDAAINDKGGTSCEGITPIYDACTNGNLDVVKLLLDRGANSNIQNDLGETALNALDRWYESAELDDEEIVSYNNIRLRLQNNLDKISGTLNDSDSNKNVSLNASTSSSSSRNTRGTMNSTRQTPSAIITTRVTSDFETSDVEDSAENYETMDTEITVLREKNRIDLKLPKSINMEKRARDDYVNTIASFRRRNVNTYQPVPDEIKLKAAHVTVADVDDAWLDDDIGPIKKKTKYLSDSIYNQTNSMSSKNKSIDSPCKSPGSTASDISDAFEVLRSADSVSSSKKSKVTSKLWKCAPSKSRQQSSLMDAGFLRFRSESPPVQINTIDETLDSNKRKSVETPQKLSQSSTSFDTPHSVKVKVEDQLLMVPVITSMITNLNIGWLAEESARRYYNLKGLRPQLRLMTTDGAIFEEADPISLVLNTEDHVNSSVLDWTLPLITQRYTDACSQMKCEIDKNLYRCMELSQATHKLIITSQIFQLKVSKPFFKCLSYENNLSVLDLSHNFLQDEGVNTLAKALATVKHLTTLNLSGNLITSTGIKYLLSSNDYGNNTRPDDYLNDLVELNLSHNPIGDQSKKYLTNLCMRIPNLKILNLKSCEFEDLQNTNFNYSNLSEFQIGFNCLNSQSLKFILRQLNSCIIEKLDLGFCLNESTNMDEELGIELVNFFDSGTGAQLRHLNLSNLNLSDNDICILLNSIQKSKQLETLNLMKNAALTALSLKCAIRQLNKLKELNFIDCNKILLTFNEMDNILLNNTDNIYPQTIQLTLSDAKKLEQKEIIEKFWYKLWRDKSVVDVRFHNVKMYVNKNKK